MVTRTARWLSVVTLLACASSTPGRAPSAPPAASHEAWQRFWTAHGVSPAPPEDFLDAPAEPLPQILNATAGQLDDATVKKWIVADLRRGRGDAWASKHLRLDIANAGVLGPPGLNGTDDGIRREAMTGAVEISCAPSRSATAASAVVAVPRELQMDPEYGLTDFVIVFRYESGAGACERVFRDGRREVMSARRSPGVPSWQLDTGELREDPVVGALWYQAHGFSCDPGRNSPTGRLCAVLETGSSAERVSASNAL